MDCFSKDLRFSVLEGFQNGHLNYEEIKSLCSDEEYYNNVVLKAISHDFLSLTNIASLFCLLNIKFSDYDIPINSPVYYDAPTDVGSDPEKSRSVMLRVEKESKISDSSGEYILSPGYYQITPSFTTILAQDGKLSKLQGFSEKLKVTRLNLLESKVAKEGCLVKSEFMDKSRWKEEQYIDFGDKYYILGRHSTSPFPFPTLVDGIYDENFASRVKRALCSEYLVLYMEREYFQSLVRVPHEAFKMLTIEMLQDLKRCIDERDESIGKYFSMSRKLRICYDSSKKLGAVFGSAYE